MNVKIFAAAIVMLTLAAPAAQPEEKSQRDCLFFVGAHPDDTEGYAATAFLLAKKYDIHVVDLTRGERGLGEEGYLDGTTAARRIAEEKAACAVLGATPHFLGEIDGEACASMESARRLFELFLKYKPKAVFTHWPVDVHSDHIQTTAVVAHALDMVQCNPGWHELIRCYYYEVLMSQTQNWHPIFSVDVTSTMEKKREMLSKYVCQNPDNELVEEKTRQAALRGSQREPKCAYAETFTSKCGVAFATGVLEELAEAVVIPASRPAAQDTKTDK